ncbi:uncharacterized protein LOC135486716 isoform X1 [Lineus longissimus]|uniref:uncharacterized protein LOC135486716 isoform X1 n=1 Tax=Lineus longissimus TaxID=88925 RepID=UPI00315C698C
MSHKINFQLEPIELLFKGWNVTSASDIAIAGVTAALLAVLLEASKMVMIKFLIISPSATFSDGAEPNTIRPHGWRSFAMHESSRDRLHVARALSRKPDAVSHGPVGDWLPPHAHGNDIQLLDHAVCNRWHRRWLSQLRVDSSKCSTGNSSTSACKK